MKSIMEKSSFRGTIRRCIPATFLSLLLIVLILGLGRPFVPSDSLPGDNTLISFPYFRSIGPDLGPQTGADSIQDAETEDIKHIEKRQGAPFVITGINWNGIRQRQDWDAFEADRDLFNLFVCGLEAWQALNQNARDSYFQIAGIHGAPYTSWDNVNGPFPNFGYCTHGSILFATWHRPYLAAVEQIVGNIMRNLANQYPAGARRTRYQNAANRFRLPYWDWAKDARVPRIIGNETSIAVEKPQGFVTIPNPLFSYAFHPFSAGFFPYPPFNAWPRTVRQPDSNGNSRPAEFNRQLVANQISIRNRVFNILNYQHEYRIFSNKAWNGGNSGNQDSIESIHDLIHGAVGGGGHMAVVDTSAMDPIFWFHHANVDRIVAMWQTLNPKSFAMNQISLFGTRLMAPGSVEGPNSPLYPFRRTPTEFWNSNSARRHTSFGYTYPELADAGTVPDYRLRHRLRGRIENLYGRTAPQSQLRETIRKRSIEGRAPRKADFVKNHKYHEWTAGIRVNKHVAAGPYMVHIFVGNPTEGVDWTQDPKFAGSYYLFSKNGTCRDCVEESIVTGAVPLTNILIQCAEQGHINNIDPSNVIPYLKKNISWRVQMPDAKFINPGDIPSLKISVSAAEVTIPATENEDAPISDWTTYYDITTEKPGGLCYGDKA